MHFCPPFQSDKTQNFLLPSAWRNSVVFLFLTEGARVISYYWRFKSDSQNSENTPKAEPAFLCEGFPSSKSSNKKLEGKTAS